MIPSAPSPGEHGPMRRPGARILPLLFFVAACGGRDLPPPPAPVRAPPPPPAVTAAPTAAPETPPEPQAFEDSTTPEDAERVLFLATDLRTDHIRDACQVTLDRAPRIRCLLSLRYADEPESGKLALTLLTETGSLAGLLPEETTDDGRGGKVHLLPARPIGPNRELLTWIIDAFRDYKSFLDGLTAHLPPAASATTASAGASATTAPNNPGVAVGERGDPAGTGAPPAINIDSAAGANGIVPAAVSAAPVPKVAFRDRPVHFRFFYSEKGGNPSAFAIKRNIGFNLFGTLNVTDVAVRDTLFHEIFHLNDARLGEWASVALTPIRDAILARCGRKNACLGPYSPTDTMMNGAFYAFTDTSGAREYGAEIGLRYYREHRLILRGEPLPIKAFKCGPPENAAAWRLVADTFFGGVDLVPPC